MKKRHIVAYVWLILTACFLILPLVATGIYSFTKSWTGILPTSWTLDYYEQVFSDAKFWPAMARGLIISIAPIILSGIVVILALYTAILYDPRLEKYIQSLCMLPYTLKGVILAISVLSLYAGSHTIFSNRIVMLTCVYSIIIFPYVYQGIRNNMDAINIPQLIEAAEILGAGKLYAFVRIIVPNMLSGIMVSSLLAMSVVFSDYVVVKIIAGSKYITGQQLLYAARNQAGQYSSVIVLIMFGTTLLVSALAYGIQNRTKKNGVKK